VILRVGMISLLCKSAELKATLCKWWMELTFVDGGHSGGLCMLLIFIPANNICSGLFKDDTSSLTHLISTSSTGELQIWLQYSFFRQSKSLISHHHNQQYPTTFPFYQRPSTSFQTTFTSLFLPLNPHFLFLLPPQQVVLQAPSPPSNLGERKAAKQPLVAMPATFRIHVYIMMSMSMKMTVLMLGGVGFGFLLLVACAR
jgi:hypothetical protein